MTQPTHLPFHVVVIVSSYLIVFELGKERFLPPLASTGGMCRGETGVSGLRSGWPFRQTAQYEAAVILSLFPRSLFIPLSKVFSKC